MSSPLHFGYPRFDFDRVESTMTEASLCAEAGAEEGTIVIADQQTEGRGRLGRSWISEPGMGLYFSLVLRPPTSPEHAAVLTLAMGLGVARGLAKASGSVFDIRWPNDVLLNGKKCCGILVESVADVELLRYAIVGVGVNVNQQNMPKEIAASATSLRANVGHMFDKEAVLDDVLCSLEFYYALFCEQGAASIIEAFSKASSYVSGKSVRVDAPGGDIYGVTAGLSDAGVLLLSKRNGSIEPILAGSVRPWPKQ
ncbi:MAG: biotin--[acetyl-CoA-carboxylase] ligase [Solibacterales bacterium]|nr:biotin--[acetyl-CoA-carboxylase] ligase [Bryobacterales bacterium]|tara:strand:- start:457 stop:1218 length:762 start_codon:yes stop_codon:yes gene_type:complete